MRCGGPIRCTDLDYLDTQIEIFKNVRAVSSLVAVAGVHGQPALLMRRAGLHDIPGKLLLSTSLPQALARVRHYLGETATGRPLLTEQIS